MNTPQRRLVARLLPNQGPPLVLALLLTLAWPLTGNTAEGDQRINVKGKIPSGPCSVTLSHNNGSIDYGTIPRATLTRGSPKKLPPRYINLSISCSAAAKMALIFSDNRADSRIPGITLPDKASDNYNYGLGLVNGKKVGGFALTLIPESTADDKALRKIFSDDQGKTWKLGATYLQHAGHWFSFAENNDKTLTFTPIAFRQVRAQIRILTTINNLELLPDNQDVPLDGAATIEMRYI